MLYGGCRKGRSVCPWHQRVFIIYIKEIITTANVFYALNMCQNFLFYHLLDTS